MLNSRTNRTRFTNDNEPDQALDPRKWLILLELKKKSGQNGNQIRKSLKDHFLSFCFPAHHARNLYNWLGQLEQDGFITAENQSNPVVNSKYNIKNYRLTNKGGNVVRDASPAIRYAAAELAKLLVLCFEIPVACGKYKIQNLAKATENMRNEINAEGLERNFTTLKNAEISQFPEYSESKKIIDCVLAGLANSRHERA